MTRTMRYVAAVGCITCVAVALFAYARTRNVIVLNNASGQTVVSMVITVRGDEVEFGELATGDTAAEHFAIHTDSSFEVTGELADGTPVRGSFGYVTNGMYGETATFSVQPDGSVVFDQR